MRPRVLLAVSLTAALAACGSKKSADQQAAPPPPAPADAAAPPAPPPDPMTIIIENKRQTPIWVADQSDCARLPYRVEAPDGTRLTLDGQTVDCATARAGNCPVIGACPGAGVHLLPPGKTLETTWDSYHLVGKQLGKGEAGAGCPDACVERALIGPGTYKVVVEAWSACTGDCPCADDPKASCAKPAGLAAAPDLSKVAPVMMPGTAGVNIVFLDPPPPP